MSDKQDDLTLVYMYGFKNGQESMKAEIERLQERGGDWCAAMTENHDLWRENERLRAALRDIREVYARSEGGEAND